MTEERALLAGGCFWGVQDLFRRYDGVLSTAAPQAATRPTQPIAIMEHMPKRSKSSLILPGSSADPRVLLPDSRSEHAKSPGNDVGASYRSAIFYTTDEQRRIAEDTIADVDASVVVWQSVTESVPAGDFGRPSPSTRITSCEIPAATRAISFDLLEATDSQEQGTELRRDWPWRWTHALATGPYPLSSMACCAVSPPGVPCLTNSDQSLEVSRGGESTRELTASRPASTYSRDFPVLSAGPTPHVPLSEWTFSMRVGNTPLGKWTWKEFQDLPQTRVTVDIHCVTKRSKLDTVWEGVTIDAL